MPRRIKQRRRKTNEYWNELLEVLKAIFLIFCFIFFTAGGRLMDRFHCSIGIIFLWQISLFDYFVWLCGARSSQCRPLDCSMIIICIRNSCPFWSPAAMSTTLNAAINIMRRSSPQNILNSNVICKLFPNTHTQYVCFIVDGNQWLSGARRVKWTTTFSNGIHRQRGHASNAYRQCPCALCNLAISMPSICAFRDHVW